jgi:hypothetical protein
MKRHRLAAGLAACTLLTFCSVAYAAALQPFDAGSPEAIGKENSGHAYVLAFWSIHCAPCLQDMSDWRALQIAHPDIPVILVTTDGPADHAQVEKVLERYHMGPLQSWAFADEFNERVRFAVDRSWRGELPRTYFYDRDRHMEARTGRLNRQWAEHWFKRQQ